MHIDHTQLPRISAPVSRRAVLLSSIGAAAAAAMPRLARAAASLDGRNIRILLPTEQDVYARPFADRLRVLFPGATVAVQIEAAAGGKLAAKMLSENAGGDITLGLVSGGLMFAQLLGEEGVSYDFNKFRWVGSMTDDRRVLMVSKRSGIAGIEELKTRPATFGVMSLTSTSSYDARLLNAILGIKLRIVPGFKTAERLKGVIAGELDSVGGSYATIYSLIEAGEAHVVLRYTSAELPAEAMKAPLLRDLVTGGGWQSRIADLLELQSRMGRLVAASPATTDEDLMTLRSAFDSITGDPAFQEELKKLEAPVDPEPGKTIEAGMQSLMADPGALAADLKAAISCGLEISEGTREACEL